MSEDFVTRLRLQLREAAEREERRGDWRQRAAVVRGRLPRLALNPAAVAVAVVVAIVAVGAVLATLRPQPAQTPKPKPLPYIDLGTELGAITTAFGSVWVDQPATDQLLRVDPRTRKVIARVPVPGDVTLATGNGSLWVVTANAVLRIDPATNRVVANIRSTAQTVDPNNTSSVLAAGGRVWIVGNYRAQRIDPRTNRAVTPITLATGGYEVTGADLNTTDLWVTTSGGRLLRLDPTNGSRRATFRDHTPLWGYPLIAGRVLLLGSSSGASGGDQLARVDPRTGRLLWRISIYYPGPIALADDRLWIETQQRGRRTVRVLAIDPETGGIVKSVRTGEFTASGLTAVGSKLWMTTPAGRIVIIPMS